MRIAPKIVLLFLPLVVVPVIFVGFSASVAALEGISGVAQSLLRFKAEELVRFSQSQHALLEENDLLGEERFVTAAKETVSSYAAGLTRTDSELIAAVTPDGEPAFATGEFSLSEREQTELASLLQNRRGGSLDLTLGGVRRVGELAEFDPFDWVFLVTEERQAFFAPVEAIYTRAALVLTIVLLAAIPLIIVFSKLITRPLNTVVQAMQGIVDTGDLSRRVDVPYADETGVLGDSFNVMTEALSDAYGEIKSYALKAAVSQKREAKVRNVFQKYAPQQVIEQYFAAPESMLVGENRRLAILFSDIRDFTSISEQMESGEVVESLNEYFGRMVDIIMEHQGVVDKYIGDAVMAFYGAPAEDTDSAFHAVSTGLDMMDALLSFNEWQREHGRREFRIGVGINYGDVTIGNIGSERKMDYTVVGDMVNLASRLEGLTKVYSEPIIISDSVRRRIKDRIPCRMIDRVRVKGKRRGVALFAVRRELNAATEKAWKIHHAGLRLYYDGRFEEASRYFAAVEKLLPGDTVAAKFRERSTTFASMSLPDDWDGVVTISEK